MEKKSKSKKLVIRKETLRTLSESSLQAVAGGLRPFTPSCLHCSGGGHCTYGPECTVTGTGTVGTTTVSIIGG
jgi:hypothetical protein